MSFPRFLPWVLIALAALAAPPDSHALEIRNARVQPSRFSPNGDGVKDSAYVRFEASEPVDYIYMRIYDAHGGLVASLSQSSAAGTTFTGPMVLAWAGRTNAGAPAPEGTFTISLGASRGIPAPEVPLTVSVDFNAPRIAEVSVPGPLTPSLPSGLLASLIRFKVTGLERRVSGASDDTVLVWVEKSPGARFEPDDTLEAAPDSIHADTTWYSATWTPADTARNDGLHTVHIETLDEAGNTGGGGSWSVDLILHGPAIRVTEPAEPARRPALIVLPFIPDSVHGTVNDRSGVRNLIAQFAASAPETLSLVPGTADTLRWSVALPESLRKDGTFPFTLSSTNIPGYITREARTYQLDTAAPPPPTIAAGIPRRVRREALALSVSAALTDSLVRVLVRSDGVTQRTVRRILGTLTDTLRFTPGGNFVSYTSKDAAGNVSTSVGDSVYFDTSEGLVAPQSFHAGDAFSARLAAAGSGLDVRVYRTDGGFVRTLTTSVSADGTGRNFEVLWDLKNDAGIAVGRGPYVCIMTATLTSGERITRRTAVVALP